MTRTLLVPCRLDGLKHAGSARIRCDWVAAHWDGAEVYDTSQRFAGFDLYIFQKAYLSATSLQFIGRAAQWRDEGKCRLCFDLCVSGNTLVLTSRGWRPIKNIKVGERVVTHTGDYRPVLQKFEREAETIRLEPGGLPEICVTDNHPLLYCPRRTTAGGIEFSSWEWVAAGQTNGGAVASLERTLEYEYGTFLKQFAPDNWWEYGDGYLRPRHGKRYNPIQNYLKLTDETCWMLGYWVAGGTYGKHNISFAVDDSHEEVVQSEEVVQRLINILRSLGLKPNVSKRKDGNTITISCGSLIWRNFMYQEFGVKDEKRIPGLLMDLPTKRKTAFLSGYLTGDGCFKDSGGIRAGSISKNIAFSIWQMLRDIGLIPAMSYSGKMYKRRPQWVVRLNPRESLKFMAMCDVPEVKRANVAAWKAVKHNNTELRRNDNYVAHPVRRIAEGEVRTVYNLEVAVDNSYIADGIIVHNCDPDFLDWEHKTRLLDVLPLFDFCVGATDPITDWLKRYNYASTILDCVDVEAVRQIGTATHTDTEKPFLVWAGYESNQEPLMALLPAIGRLGWPLETIVVKSSIPFEEYWRRVLTSSDGTPHDILLNPQPDTGKFRYKSDNKTMIAHALGLSVAMCEADLHRLADPAERAKDKPTRPIAVAVEAWQRLAEVWYDR